MANDQWTDRLSEYLDGELSGDERSALEAHLESCEACRTVLDELRLVVDTAHALEDRPPPADLWSGIEETIRQDARTPDATVHRLSPWRRRISITVPQLAAAAVATVLLSVGLAWMALRGPGGPATPIAAGPSGPSGPSGRAGGPGAVRLAADRPFPAAAENEYDAAVAELEGVLEENRDELSPGTVRILEENLAIIDQAIQEAYQALAQDPSDPYLNHHLAQVRSRKLQLLRQATEIVRAET